MSNTINVPVGETWTEVSTVTGYASPTQSCQYCVSVGAPSETLRGHRVSSDGLRFEPAAGEALYFKADSADQGVVAVFTGG